MNILRVAVVAGLCLLPSVQAQDADSRYIAVYNAIQQADNLAAGGQPQDALNAYVDAQAKLEKFSKLFPNWDAGIVAYRLDDLEKKIAVLKAQLAPKKPSPTEAPPASNLTDQPASPTRAAADDDLAVKLAAVQLENQTLQAKLKEALATQPAAVDATELVAAQNQLRELLKQNEMLKANQSTSAPPVIVTNIQTVVREVTTVDTEKVSALEKKLAEAAKNLAAEQARAKMLVDENSALQKNLSRGSAPSAALTVLQSENERLKSQIAALKSASDSDVAIGELSARLQDAKTQIAKLQSAASLSALDKAALENRVRKLSAQLAEQATNYDARLNDLAQQRTDLLKKLDVANARSSTRGVADAAAQISSLNKEIETLRARIAVDEAKVIPYSTEELALFRQSQPGITPSQHSIKELPAGTAELVASAQRHFSKQEFSAAEADYAKILELDQNNGLALANLATIELQEGKLADAEKHIKAALVQSPDDAYNLSTLGYLKFRQEKFDEALDALSRAAKLDAENPEIQNYLGVTLSHKGLRVQAETALRKALQLDATYGPAHNNLAVIYLSQSPSLPQLARWHYQKALDAGQPRNPDLEKLLAEKGAPVATEAPVQ